MIMSYKKGVSVWPSCFLNAEMGPELPMLLLTFVFCLVLGAWRLALGDWCLVLIGVWCLVIGAWWCLVLGAWW